MTSSTGTGTGPGRSDRPDLVQLTGLRVRGHHGVFDFERRDGQDFVVDVDLELDLRPAAASDELADTVDYGALATGLAAVLAGEPVNLLETLVERLADDLPGRPAGERGHRHRAQTAGPDPVAVQRRGRHRAPRHSDDDRSAVDRVQPR